MLRLGLVHWCEALGDPSIGNDGKIVGIAKMFADSPIGRRR